MCGITGCIVNDSSALMAVIRGLTKLQNRGYDSIGLCAVQNRELFIKKHISCDGKIMSQYLNSEMCTDISSKIAMGHTRWATHGENTLVNAHPHSDDSKRFAMIHNGIIENYNELKRELINQGYHFYGETDTEIVVKYLDFLIKNGKDYRDLNTILKGSWAMIILDSYDPDKIYFMKNGSPLILGWNKNRSKIMLVSELSGFDEDIEYYYTLFDGDYGYIAFNQTSMIVRTQFKYTVYVVPKLIGQASPNPYEHWTIKEINDQPKAIMNLLEQRFDSSSGTVIFPELDSIANNIRNADHIIFLGCGTSYHAAQVGMKIFKEFAVNAFMEVIDGADFEENDIKPNKKVVLILLSQSGETKDLHRALKIGKEMNIKSIGIINVEKSLIANEVDVCLYLKAGPEHAVASTKSFTNQVVMLVLVAMWMNTNVSTGFKQKYINSLRSLSDDYARIIDQSEKEIPKVIEYFRNENDCFILGKQQLEWVAKEGSLKIKEITYLHSEGYSAAALKHGPFALLSKNMPVIILANNDKYYPKLENITAEVKSRSARIFFITNRYCDGNNIDHLFYFETDSILFPLISIVPLQILAYRLALQRGNQPDYPRNLAKVVTVE